MRSISIVTFVLALLVSAVVFANDARTPPVTCTHCCQTSNCTPSCSICCPETKAAHCWCEVREELCGGHTCIKHYPHCVCESVR